MKGTLSVWWDGKVVGDLTLDEHGDMGFAYDAAWLADPEARALTRSCFPLAFSTTRLSVH